MTYEEKQIQEIIKKEDGTYEIIMHQGENGYNICEASWREVPRYHKDGRIKTPEEFMEEQVAKNGLVHFNQNFGNCVGYNTLINIDNSLTKIGELYVTSSQSVQTYQGFRLQKWNEVNTYPYNRRTPNTK